MPFENGHIRSRYHCGGTGNSVANYTEINYTCDECDGEGRKELDRKEFREHLNRLYEDGATFSELFAAYREWQKDPTIECPECEGQGGWTQYR